MILIDALKAPGRENIDGDLPLHAEDAAYFLFESSTAGKQFVASTGRYPLGSAVGTATVKFIGLDLENPAIEECDSCSGTSSYYDNGRGDIGCNQVATDLGVAFIGERASPRPHSPVMQSEAREVASLDDPDTMEALRGAEREQRNALLPNSGNDGKRKHGDLSNPDSSKKRPKGNDPGCSDNKYTLRIRGRAVACMRPSKTSIASSLKSKSSTAVKGTLAEQARVASHRSSHKAQKPTTIKKATSTAFIAAPSKSKTARPATTASAKKTAARPAKTTKESSAHSTKEYSQAPQKHNR